MNENYPELNTESDTTLEQPDLDQIRQDRMDRNRRFLQSVSGSTAARVLSQETEDKSQNDVRESAAIIIQKHWKRVMARNIYVGMLYEKYLKEEEEQQKKMRRQIEEGELLVENHELEVLLDDNKTTRRNAERRLISKVITIQRSWKKYQDRKREELAKSHKQIDLSSLENHESQFKDTSKNGREDTSSGSVPRSTGHRNPFNESRAAEGGIEADVTPNTDTAVNDTEDCFVNPLCVTAAGSVIDSTSNHLVLERLKYETDEDYQRRLRKQSLLSQAKQFILLKKENSRALPLNLHMYDTDLVSPLNISSNNSARMDVSVTRANECSDCDINRNSSKGNPNFNHEIPRITKNNIGKREFDTDSVVGLQTENDTNPDTKGGNIFKSSVKGDKSSEDNLSVDSKGDNVVKSSEKGDKSCEDNMSAFDVYNIETALPDLDWKTIEEKLMAARKEEEERVKARRNDREEIRKKLAMGADDDDYYDDNDEEDDISYKKPNLQSRLHSGLQICFMNESPGDTDSEGLSPRQHEIHDNMKLMQKGDDVDSDNNLKSVTDLNRTAAGTSQDKVSTPPRLKNELPGDQPEKSEDFQSRQEQLQEEAKLALAQAGTMARMQLEIEKQTQKKSPIAEMVGIPGLGERRRKKLGLRKLQEMNLAQIQVLYNDLQTQIENLNEELVHLLMERDELHMEQDSMLVDIEDLTRRAEELAEKSNAKAASKNSKNHVTGKLPGR